MIPSQMPGRCRPVAIGRPQVAVRRAGDTWYMDAQTPLGDVPRRFTDCLVRGAREWPERTLVARRGHRIRPRRPGS